MNWRVGLLRLWVVGSAIWILSGVVLAFLVSHASIEAAKLYPEYLYNHLARRALVAEARRFLGNPKVVEEVVGVPGSRLPCVSDWERKQQEAHAAELEAKEAKRSPDPSPPKSPGAYGIYGILEQTAKDLRGPPKDLTQSPPPGSSGQLSRSQVERLLMQPECSAEIQEAQAVIASDEFPSWARDALLSSAYWLFGPPFVILAIGAALLWALRGFRVR